MFMTSKLVVTVPKQVEQEPQLLHGHPVYVKTRTLNIAENTTQFLFYFK